MSESTKAVNEDTSDMPNWYEYSQNRGCCSKLSFVKKLVLLGSLGSFMFGYNIAVANTATPSINSSFLICGRDGEAWARFENVTQEVCNKHDECRSSCVDLNLGGTVRCAGGYNQKYGSLTPAACQAVPECKSICLKKEVVEKEIDYVQCPGGYNDVDCKEITWYNSILACSVLLGGAVGSAVASKVLAFGRRAMLLVTMLIFLVGIISCSLSSWMGSLIWGRVVVGIAVGLVSVGSPTYMAEVTPAESRGRYGVMHQLMIVIGIFLAMLIGLPLKDPSSMSDLYFPGVFQEFWWRFMFAIGAAPAFVALYLLLFAFPYETPVFYMEKKNFVRARTMLQLIHEKEHVDGEVNSMKSNMEQSEQSKKNGMNFRTAFQDPEYRHVILVGIILSGFQQLGGINVFVTSSAGILKKARLDGTMQKVISVIMGLINVVMTFPTLYLIEKLGRKTLMLYGSLLQFLCVIPAAIMLWVDPEAKVTSYLAIVAILGFVTFFAVGSGPVLWVYLFEIYPMEIKDVAAGVATSVNWICGVIMVFVSNATPLNVAYTLFAGLQGLNTVLVQVLMRETKGLPLGQSPFISKKSKV